MAQLYDLVYYLVYYLITHYDLIYYLGCLCGLISSMVDHKSLPPEFESWCGHIWRVFHLWLCFITFGGRSAHLAYNVHKSGC